MSRVGEEKKIRYFLTPLSKPTLADYLPVVRILQGSYLRTVLRAEEMQVLTSFFCYHARKK